MTHLSLREAAEQAGTSKSTIWRAIKSGRMSATRTDDGGFAIDPAELFRAFQPERPEQHSGGRDTTPSATTETPSGTGETAVRIAAMEQELNGVKALLEEVKANREELRRSSEAWRAQAERLALQAPAQAPTPAVLPQAPRRRWFAWRKAG